MRAWMRSLAACLVAAACARLPPPIPVVPAQVPVDLTGVVGMLLRVQPIVVMTHGRSFTPTQRRVMELDLNRAAKAVSQLSAGMPAARGAQLARDADQAILHAVGILGIPSTPGLTRWTPLIDAIDGVLTSVEVFTDEQLGRPGAKAGSNRRAPPMTADQGRKALGIRTVRE